MIAWLRAFLHRHFSADKEGAESEERLRSFEHRLMAINAFVETAETRRVDTHEDEGKVR